MMSFLLNNMAYSAKKAQSGAIKDGLGYTNSLPFVQFTQKLQGKFLQLGLPLLLSTEYSSILNTISHIK